MLWYRQIWAGASTRLNWGAPSNDKISEAVRLMRDLIERCLKTFRGRNSFRGDFCFLMFFVGKVARDLFALIVSGVVAVIVVSGTVLFSTFSQPQVSSSAVKKEKGIRVRLI